MSKYIISFHYKNQETSIQFGTNLKLKDIINSFITKSHSEGKILYFMYNGTLIEKTELTFNEIANDEDKLRKKMNVLVCEEEKDSQIIKSRANSIIKPKNIIKVMFTIIHFINVIHATLIYVQSVVLIMIRSIIF